VTTDLDTLATALYVRTDDLLKESPQLAPWRPGAGINPKLSEAELGTLAVMQALLGFTSEAYFWGLRPHLVATLGGLSATFALTRARADERQVLLAIFDADLGLLATRPGQALIGDKNYYGAAFEAALTATGARLLRPARKGEPEPAEGDLLKPLRQIIETFKGQFDLERHGGHTPQGVAVRVLQRILALTAAIWHNDRAAQRVKRSLLAHDH